MPSHAVGQKNHVKGQSQLSGAYGVFGVVYTLSNGFNCEILGAHYSVEPFAAYHPGMAKNGEKLVVVDMALKNSSPGDNYFGEANGGFITMVDDAGQQYKSENFSLASRGTQSMDWTLKPGQGLGQPSLKNALRTYCVVPGNAKIVKFMLPYGRKATSEKTLRYLIAGTSADAALQNVIKPLPAEVRDSSDPSGATALAEGTGVLGQYYPSGFFAYRLNDFAYSSDPISKASLPDGKRYAIATVTVKLLVDNSWGGHQTMFDAEDDDLNSLVDENGDKYHPGVTGWSGGGYQKAKGTESADHTFDTPGEEYTFRIFFQIPADVACKKLTLAANRGRKWAFDISSVKP